MTASRNTNSLVMYKGELPGFFLNYKDIRFDLIMLHHSLEHMENPVAVLSLCQRHIKENGIILIRVPLVDSYTWEMYQQDWVQWDAPRHFYLFTVMSIKNIAKIAGLSVRNIEYDSSKFQFEGSELYKRGIAINSSKKIKNIFSRKQKREFQRTASLLNNEKRGDQAAFYLIKEES